MNANATTLDNGNDFCHEDAILGAKVIGWTLNVMAWAIAAAIAWSFSGFWAVLLAWVFFTLLLELLKLAIALFVVVPNVSEEQYAAVGRFAAQPLGALRNLFRRS